MSKKKPYLDAVTFKWEGAYRERDPVEPAAYGYNLVNFIRDVPDIWRNLNKSGMHADVVTLMNRVVAGGSGARAAGVELFEGVGERTKEWTPGRHNDTPINQSADTLNYLESVKRIIRPLTEEKYNAKFGFAGIRDERIRHEAMDMSYIRPHSGPWALVYAATKAGILTDAKATELGFRYLTPHDANIPALVSGLPETSDGKHALPDHREKDRGKGKEYLKASKIKLLGDIINAAPEAKRDDMHKFMHEARTKFFEQAVAVEGERARWGDPEAKKLFTAHSKNNPKEGWLSRANESFNYYPREGMERAVKQAGVQAPALAATSHTFTLEAQMTASDKGLSVKWGLDKPIGEVAIETPHGLVRYKVNLKTSETGMLIEAPKGVKWVDGPGDATMTWGNGASLRITPYLNSRIGLASLSKNDFLPIMYDREGKGLDGDDVAKIQQNSNGSIIVYDADSDKKFPVAPARNSNQTAQNTPRRPGGRS